MNLDEFPSQSSSDGKTFWDVLYQLRLAGTLTDIELGVPCESDPSNYTLIPAHKLVLVGSSSYFEQALAQGELLEMYSFDGISEKNLRSVLDYIYHQKSWSELTSTSEGTVAANILGIRRHDVDNTTKLFQDQLGNNIMVVPLVGRDRRKSKTQQQSSRKPRIIVEDVEAEFQKSIEISEQRKNEVPQHHKSTVIQSGQETSNEAMGLEELLMSDSLPLSLPVEEKPTELSLLAEAIVAVSKDSSEEQVTKVPCIEIPNEETLDEKSVEKEERAEVETQMDTEEIRGVSPQEQHSSSQHCLVEFQKNVSDQISAIDGLSCDVDELSGNINEVKSSEESAPQQQNFELSETKDVQETETVLSSEIQSVSTPRYATRKRQFVLPESLKLTRKKEMEDDNVTETPKRKTSDSRKKTMKARSHCKSVENEKAAQSVRSSADVMTEGVPRKKLEDGVDESCGEPAVIKAETKNSTENLSLTGVANQTEEGFVMSSGSGASVVNADANVKVENTSEENMAVECLEEYLPGKEEVDKRKAKKEIVENEGGPSCDKCGKTFRTLSGLNIHTRWRHSDETDTQSPSQMLECELCDQQLCGRSGLARHMRFKHKKKKLHTCSECFMEFALVKEMRDHQMNEHNILPFDCDTCDAHFKTSEGYKIHMFKMHKDVLPTHMCELCGKVFKMRHELYRHVKYTHSEEPMYSCSLCEQAFKARSTLRRHIRTFHSNQRNHVCDVCNSRFKSITDMKKHRDLHFRTENPLGINHKRSSRAKWVPRPCKHCGKTFVKKENLLSHEKNVHEEKESGISYTCSVCNKSFSVKSYLQQHIIAKHRPARYQCTSCDQTYTHRYMLKRHAPRCKGVPSFLKPFQCHVCGAGFLNKSNFTKHIQEKCKPKDKKTTVDYLVYMKEDENGVASVENSSEANVMVQGDSLVEIDKAENKQCLEVINGEDKRYIKIGDQWIELQGEGSIEFHAEGTGELIENATYVEVIPEERDGVESGALNVDEIQVTVAQHDVDMHVEETTDAPVTV